MSKQTAAELYLMSKNKSIDQTLLILNILKLTQNQDITKILEFYSQMQTGIIKVVQVESASTMSSALKKSVEKIIEEKIGTNSIILYEVTPAIIGGLRIKIDDNMLDESVLGQIELFKL